MKRRKILHLAGLAFAIAVSICWMLLISSSSSSASANFYKAGSAALGKWSDSANSSSMADPFPAALGRFQTEGGASFSVFPSALDFGTVSVGTTSSGKTVTIVNTSTDGEDVFVYDACAGESFQFFSDYCEGSRAANGRGHKAKGGNGDLGPGDSLVVNVFFAPTVVGPQFDQLEIDTSVGSYFVQLSGNIPGAAGSLSFSQPAYTVNENAGSVTIAVVRTGGSSGNVSAAYNAVSGSAVAGKDFSPSAGTLSFSDGETAAKTFTVPIIDNNMIDGNRTFTVSLSGATGGATLGGMAPVTIIDDDIMSQPAIVGFSSSSYSVREDSGAATITVTRSGNTKVPVTVNYSASGGSAAAGVNFLPASGALNFAANSNSLSFNVRVLHDDVASGNKTVDLTLSGVGEGGQLGGVSRATLTILDIDLPPNPPILEVGPTTNFNFGGINVGEMGMETITLKNSGGGTLNLDAPMLQDGMESGFAIASQPSQMSLNAGESTSFDVTVTPAPGSVGNSLGGKLNITSNGGSSAVTLRAQSIDTIPPKVNISNLNGGETLTAGSVFKIQFSATDNDSLSNFTVSYSLDGGASSASDIGRLGSSSMSGTTRVSGQVSAQGEVTWNLPANLQSSLGRILITAMDNTGNMSVTKSGLFSIQKQASNNALIQTVITFSPPPAGQVAPPSNTEANASEIRTDNPFSPLLRVDITFNAPPTGEVAPPQNVQVSAQPASTNNSPQKPRVVINRDNIHPSAGATLAGYNVYRVPEPPDGTPLPTPDQIVSPNNLVATLGPDATSFTDMVSTNQSNNYVYSLTSFFGDGSMSDGSSSQGTDLPIVKDPAFVGPAFFIDAGGSFIKSGATLIVNDTESYALIFDDSGTRFTVGKKVKSTPDGLLIKKVIKKGSTVSLTVKNTDGKTSVPISFTRTGGGSSIAGNNKATAPFNIDPLNTHPADNGAPQLIGFNIYRVPEPSDGSAPDPGLIVSADNLIGSVPANVTTFTDVVEVTNGQGTSAQGIRANDSQNLSNNYSYSITSFFGNGQQSSGSTPAASTNLPVIKNPTLDATGFFIDAGGSFIKDGAKLIINDTDQFNLIFDDSGTRFTVGKNAKGSMSGLPISQAIPKGVPVRLTVQNPDGKISVGVAFTHK